MRHAALERLDLLEPGSRCHQSAATTRAVSQPAVGRFAVDGEHVGLDVRVLPGGDAEGVEVRLGRRAARRAGRAWVGCGRWRATRSMAPSCSVPVGSPSASRTIRPPAGSGVARSIPAIASARELAHATWPSSL